MTKKMQKIDADSPETKSADLVAENIARLKALFPELVTEGEHGHSVNVDVLKQLVGDKTLTDAEEKYGLNWFGKRKARDLALLPSLGTLRPAPEESVDWDTTQNLMIEGDNLEVLKLLQKSYAGKVKLIYIDPPYNTGKDFVYPDDFRDNIRNYQELTGQIEGGRRVSSNTEANGRFHTDWLNMMWPRIKVARDLLREDGLLFVSIDDTELSNTRSVLDEIFGADNHVATLIHQRAKGGGQAKHVVKGHDYVIVMARSIDDCVPLRRDKVVQGSVETIDGKEYLIDNDVVRKQFGKYDKSAGDRRCFYEELLQYKGEKFKQEIDQRIETGDLFLMPWGNGMHAICKRTLIDDATSKLYSIIRVLSEEGKKDLENLSLSEAASYPKPVEFITQIVRASTDSANEEIVIDFFSGSGTTGHAVMAQNVNDVGNRRHILVQFPESLDPENKEQKAAANFCDSLGKPRTIAEVTKERLRRAGNKLKTENPDWKGDTGFRVFKLDSSNIRAWNPQPEDIKTALLDHTDHLVEGRTEQDLLYELLLKLGLDLCVPIEERRGAKLDARLRGQDDLTAYSVGGGVLMACLVPHITNDEVEAVGQGLVAWHNELAPAGETTCVFRDSAFADDVAKTNMTAILEQNGITQIRSL